MNSRTIPLSLRWSRKTVSLTNTDGYSARAGTFTLQVHRRHDITSRYQWAWAVWFREHPDAQAAGVGRGVSLSLLVAQRSAENLLRRKLTQAARAMKFTLVPHGGIATILEGGDG